MSLNPFCVVYGHGGLRIGKDTRIAAQCIIIPSNHNFSDPTRPIRSQGETCLGIEIGSDVWLGAGVRVLDGVIIGDGCVVGANSVVNRSLSPYGVYAGVPARKIGTRDP